MVPDKLVVGNQVVDVLDTWSHGGNTYAKVQGGHIEGFVEVPDNPASPNYQVYCEGCGHIEEDPKTGLEELVDPKEHTVNHEGSVRVLADIHEHKTNHTPVVREVAA